MEFLTRWRSSAGETQAGYCHRRVLEAAHVLGEGWGTTALSPLAPELVATQAMVRLPVGLRVDDVPGQPGVGVRATLRSKYKVEAAIGNFGPEIGAYVRLSYAVYNTADEVERLRDGVLAILHDQQQQ